MAAKSDKNNHMDRENKKHEVVGVAYPGQYFFVKPQQQIGSKTIRLELYEWDMAKSGLSYLAHRVYFVRAIMYGVCAYLTCQSLLLGVPWDRVSKISISAMSSYRAIDSMIGKS